MIQNDDFFAVSRQTFAENRKYNRLRYMNYLWVGHKPLIVGQIVHIIPT